MAVERKAKARRQYVEVAYRGLHQIRYPVSPGTHTYTFLWSLKEHPVVGMWVHVSGGSGTTTGVITATGAAAPNGVAVVPVLGLVPQDRINAALEEIARQDQAEISGMPIWLDMMRAKAGLKVERELPAKAPIGFPAIPPLKGKVIGQPAYDRGRVWMRAHHRALELGRPDEEVQLFHDIAQEWYKRGRKRKAD